ncbi:DNA primase small subunit protein [Dioscorea alata]|uniref:DNA primase small subunit protein n=2 Tax=Dioscorea alata TaxID=55571 RepID=A0ACB7TW65_DIOAL|nr:DNA primase small subunit protein [Dioscorea alata]KAH7652240.1 DNA primase small subunit protein [Dioscorea alata]
MSNEEILDGDDHMQIDGHDSELQRSSKVPQGFNADYLKVYYGKLFPYDDIFKWMSYGNAGKHPACDPSYFGRREFSFSLGNDTYCRYQSFNSVTEFENSIKKNCPFKIDIGPVYRLHPAKRFAYAQSGSDGFAPVERELVFDIDISDYDDVRHCCSGADVCTNCWPLMTIAIKVIDTALRDDFGFNHILWVFSGRRGVHCWVCDSRARRLNNDERASIAKYFHVYKCGESGFKKVSLAGSVLHPFLARSYTDVLRIYFEEKLLCNQSLLSSEDRYEKILELVSNKSITDELHDKWQGHRRSSNTEEDLNITRWEQLKHVLQSGKQKGLRRCVEEIVFLYTYPRLDMEVSKHMNHLLKSPFCVHPKTGRVCVPIDPAHCDEFDPTTVPTLSTLLEELNKRGDNSESSNELESTSLGQYITMFRSCFLEPLLKSCKEEMENAYNANLQQSRNSLSW